MKRESTRDRAFELLADRATEGLAAAQQVELDDLLSRHPYLDENALDLTAAELALAPFPADLEPLPTTLRDKLERQGRAMVSSVGAQSVGAQSIGRPPSTRSFEADPFESVAAPGVDLRSWKGVRQTLRSPWLGFATAATLLIALGWFFRYANTPIETECLLSHVPAVVASVERSELLAEPDVLRADWRPAGGAASFATVAGDIVWSPRRQEGIVQLRGFESGAGPPVLHLWIIDGQGREPIDGGIIDFQSPGNLMLAVALQNGDEVRPIRFELTLEVPEELRGPGDSEPVLIASLETGTLSSGAAAG